MCGRITAPASQRVIDFLHLKYDLEPVEQHVNVAPTLRVPVIADTATDTLKYMHWGLIPWHSKTGKMDFSTFNATVEKLNASPLWKPLVGKKHCVFITTGFYEWQYDDPIKKKGSHPHLIRTATGPFTYMAGLWETWTNKETGEIIPSCSMITLPANSIMSRIHNTKGRMPAFLTEETSKIWLESELPPVERLKALEPVPDEFLTATEISKVGDVNEVGPLIC